MTPEEARRVGYALVALLDALGDHGQVHAIRQRVVGRWTRWEASADSDPLKMPFWPRVRVHSHVKWGLADALDDLAAKIRERESRRRP